MKHREPISALLLAVAFLLTCLFPAAGLAQPSAGESSTFTASVNLPETLEGEADVEVLAGTSMQLIACYGGKYEAPAGTQFCWQYSTTGEPDSFNYLAPSLTDNSHVTGNAVNFTASAGITWYRAVLDGSTHQMDTDFSPDESTVVTVKGADFLFTEPVRTPQPITALPGHSVTLGPVSAANTKDAAVSYQWLELSGETWKEVEGATAATFETGGLDAGTYQFRCRATAALTGGEPSSIVSQVYTVGVQPLAVAGYSVRLDGEDVELSTDHALTADAGTTAELTVKLTDGSVSASYQWQYAAPSGGWFDLRAGDGVWGFASQTLCVPVTGLTDGNRYRCAVTAGDSVLGLEPEDPVVVLRTADPAAAVAGITPSPFISCPLAGGSTQVLAPVGMPVIFTVSNRSSVEIPDEYLRYQWESAASAGGTFTAVSGATDAECVVRPGADTTAFYRCRVSNIASANALSAVSNTLELTALEPAGTVYFTEPLTEPEPVDLRPGDEHTFTAQAQTDDGSPVDCQWQYARAGSASAAVGSISETAWTNISGATDPVYTATDLAGGYYFYRCVAVNREDAEQQAISPAFQINVVPYSTKPVVEPSEMTTGLGGLPTPRYIPVGAAVGGAASLQVEASVPSGDRLDYTWYMVPSGPNQTAELLDDCHEPTLVLQNIPADYDACSFYCIVSNRAHRTQQTRSGAWYFSIWSAARQPEIISQPRGIVMDYDPADPAADLTVSVTARRSTSAVLEKRTDDGAWSPSDIAELKKSDADGTPENESASQTYSGTIPLNAGSFALNGTYRVRVNNGTASVPGLPPCTMSDPFSIFIGVSGQPLISADPEPQSAAVGTQAVFTASATVDPAGTPLTCCWQVSENGGASYRNCLTADGEADGTTFTTAVLTEQMRAKNPQLLYRCLVANAATGQWIMSSSAALTVTEGEPSPPPVTDDPEITVASGSDLMIADGEITGLTVTSRGTEAAIFLAALEAPAGYHLQLVTGDGMAVAEDAPVATGMRVELVRDLDPDEIPAALTVIVRGDVAGSGRLTIVQLTAMARAVNGQSPLDGAYLKAGDFNASGAIDVSDLVNEAKLLTKAD